MWIWGRADDGSVIEVIDSGDPSVINAQELERRWPPFGLQRIEGDAPPAAEITETIDTANGWDRVESALGLFAAERLDGLVAIHAAMLVHDGHAIMIPGASHAGKTTLAVAAIDAGVTVASDEYALVDLKSGLVHGWPRPLRIRLADGELERRPLPEYRNDPVPVAMVAAIRYSPGGPPISPISRADALQALLENCVCGSSRPADAFDAAVKITSGSISVGGCHDDAQRAVEHMMAMLSEP